MFSNLTNFFYLLAFIALSGYHVTFLNPESILAICFFIFFLLIVNNSSAVIETLDDYKQGLNSQLTELWVNGSKQSLLLESQIISAKAHLLENIQKQLKP